MKSPLRSLLIIYAIAILLGTVEYIGAFTAPDNLVSPVHLYSAAMSYLYPKTAEAEFLMGRQFEVQAGQGFNREEFRRNPDQYRKFLEQTNKDLTEASRHFQRAIELGLKSDEMLYYHYALTLMRLQEDPVRIDQAIAEWRRNFPFSAQPDLQVQRQRIEEQLQQIPTSVRPTNPRKENSDKP